MRVLRFNANTACRHFAEGHRPGQNHWLRNQHHRAVRHLTRRLIEEQLDLDEPVSSAPPPAGADLGDYPWDLPRNLLREVRKLIAHYRLDVADVRYVNHPTGSMSWAEFESVAGSVTFFDSGYALKGLDPLFAVVGTDWYIGIVSSGDGSYLGCVKLPPQLQYHQQPRAEQFAERYYRAA
jgi:hypothetical protein